VFIDDDSGEEYMSESYEADGEDDDESFEEVNFEIPEIEVPIIFEAPLEMQEVREYTEDGLRECCVCVCDGVCCCDRMSSFLVSYGA
jgi:hypothetical protein